MLKISIPVIIYNSSKTVIETLDSVLNQDYGSSNIELIIADDCSTDDTVDVVNSWLEKNAHNFDSYNFITRSENLGIVKNMDDAYRQCSHDWIKFIAGDDLLLPDCISTYVKNISNDTTIMAGQAEIITKEGVFEGEVLPTEENIDKMNNMTSEQQIVQTLKKYFIISPTFFISKKALEEINYLSFNNRRFLEDTPFLIECLLKGNKLKILNTPVVKHRRGGLSSGRKPKSFYKTRRYDYELEIRSVFTEYMFKKNIPFKARLVCLKKYLNISKRLIIQKIKYYL